MFYNIAFSPFVFDQSFICKDREKRAIDTLLDRFKCYKGYLLLCGEKEKWDKLIQDYFKSYPSKECSGFKSELLTYLKYFLSNNRLIFNHCNYHSEEEFLENQKQLFVTHWMHKNTPHPRAKKPSELKGENFPQNLVYDRMTKEVVSENLRLLLSFSKKIIFIDTYFIPGFKREVIDLIEAFASSGWSKSAKIEFHVRYSEQYHEKNVKAWKNVIKKSKHEITVYIWNDKGSDVGEGMHDRYILTEYTTVGIGKGVEVHGEYWTTTYWSVLEDDQSKLRKKFRENSSNFLLKEKLCSKTILLEPLANSNKKLII